METLKEQFIQVMFTTITMLNGDTTEEDLNMAITKSITNDTLKNATVIDKDSKYSGIIENVYNTVADDAHFEKNGAWVYNVKSIVDFTFERHDTIADAIRAAVKLIGAKVLCNGEEVIFDVINDEEAYYIDTINDVARIVKLNE